MKKALITLLLSGTLTTLLASSLYYKIDWAINFMLVGIWIILLIFTVCIAGTLYQLNLSDEKFIKSKITPDVLENNCLHRYIGRTFGVINVLILIGSGSFVTGIYYTLCLIIGNIVGVEIRKRVEKHKGEINFVDV